MTAKQTVAKTKAKVKTPPKTKTKTPPRAKTASGANHRRYLTAIRTPSADDPTDFYFDAPTAWARMGELFAKVGPTMSDEADRVRLTAPMPLPAKLTLKGELARIQDVRWLPSTWVAKNASRALGNSATDSIWNLLIGLWIDLGGWDLALDLILPNPRASWARVLDDHQFVTKLTVLRRYVHRASDADYERIHARVAPIFEKAVKDSQKKNDSHHAELACNYLAFTFDRDGTWSARLLRDHLANKLSVTPHVFASVLDASLILEVFEVETPPSVDFVFDLVESMGGAAVPVLDAISKRRERTSIRLAAEERRLAAALETARALA